jgi:integrative and conjugative element protein (TIGR02256 family)
VIWQNPLDALSKVLVEPSVLSLIYGHRQFAVARLEAGGILLGFRRDPHLHVTTATEPRESDSRARTRFDRRDASHHRAAIDAWHTSGGTMDYVGEWHTHPETSPRPSSLDLFEWRKICSRTATPMVFAICGNNGTIWMGVGFEAGIYRAMPLTSEPSACR